MCEQATTLILAVTLRYPDGSPVADVLAWIENLTDNTEVSELLTDSTGSGAWEVESGVYDLSLPDYLRATLPVLVAPGSGLAVPGMVAQADCITYHLVLVDGTLAFDATPQLPLPTPVHCLKETTCEWLIPQPPRLAQSALGVTPVYGVVGAGAESSFLTPAADRRLVLRRSTDWILPARPEIRLLVAITSEFPPSDSLDDGIPF